LWSYRLEGSDLLVAVRVERLLKVIDSHPSLQVTQESIGILRHALVGPITRLEVHDSGPVVGEVLREAAGGASSPLRNVRCGVHGRVEAISSDDLVQMGRRDDAGLDDGVEALDAQSRASKAEVGFRWRDERKSDSEPLHVGEQAVDDDAFSTLDLDVVRGKWRWPKAEGDGVRLIT